MKLFAAVCKKLSNQPQTVSSHKKCLKLLPKKARSTFQQHTNAAFYLNPLTAVLMLLHALKINKIMLFLIIYESEENILSQFVKKTIFGC